MRAPLTYGSVCSGIEAATAAWHPLGWKPSFFSEIEAFPSAVLRHHYPEVPLHGDFTTIQDGEYDPIDLLVGGTPCQDYSVAGLREGLDGDRGNLTLEYARLARRLGVRWFLWENVPGVFSTNAGRDFGAILATFAGYPQGHQFKIPEGGWRNAGIVPARDADGYGLAWRVLDAQYFGVPQRRRRVFIVGYTGDWRRAAAVLFERESLLRDITPRREKGQTSPTIPSRSSAGGGLGTDFDCDGGLIAGTLDAAAGRSRGAGINPNSLISSTGSVAHCLNAGGMGRQDFETETLVAHTLRAEGHDASEDGTGRGVPLIPVKEPIAYRIAGDGVAYLEGDATAPLTTATDKSASIVAFDLQQVTSPLNRSKADPDAASPALNTAGKMSIAAVDTYNQSLDCISHTIRSSACQDAVPAVAFDLRGREDGAQFEGPHDTANIRASSGGSSRSYVAASAVRRLTPKECERLQGFPDNFTRIPTATNGGWRDVEAAEDIDELRASGLPVKLSGNAWRVKDPDGPRYKALGNSMAVPVMAWIGGRIAEVEALTNEANA